MAAELRSHGQRHGAIHSPDEKQRRSAIGPTTGLPKMRQRAFDPADYFEPIPAPGPSDWLANHPEPGQTFEHYRRERVNRPDKIRRKLYLQPLGEFPAATSPNLDQLKQFAEAFFTLPVELRPAVDLAGLPITSRTHPSTRERQLLTAGKLHHAVGFDISARYERLRAFSQQAGFDDEAAWLTRRLAYLKSGQ
jgi:hypothetical protein